MRKTLFMLALLALCCSIALAAPLQVDDGCPTNVARVRMNWKDLTAAEQQNYIKAVTYLKNRDQPDGINYDFFVGIHQYEPNTNQAHGTSAFMPWHRYFMWQWESYLRLAAKENGMAQADVCALAAHYWAWEETASNTQRTAAVVFNSATFGSYPKKVPKSPACVTDGVAKGWEPAYDQEADEAESYSIESNCIARQWVSSNTLTPESTLVTMITGNKAYGTSNGWLMQFQTAPHGSLHDWIGATMADMISPNDPLFFCHHANVDRYYAIWQDFWDHDRVAEASLTTSEYAQYATSTSGVTASQCGIDVCFSYLVENTDGGDDIISPTFPQDQASCATPRRMNTIGTATAPGWGGMYYRYGPDHMKTLLDSKITTTAGAGHWDWFTQDGDKKRSLESTENNGGAKVGNKGPAVSVDDDNDETFAAHPGDFSDRAIEKKWRQIRRAHPELSDHERLKMLEIYECTLNHVQQYVSDKWIHMNGLSDLDPSLWRPKCQTQNQF